MPFSISTNCTVRQAKWYSTTICSVIVHNQGLIRLMLYKTLYIHYLVFHAPGNERIGLTCSNKSVPIHIANTLSWAMTFPANHKLPCLWMTSSRRSSTATSVEELRGNNMELFCKSLISGVTNAVFSHFLLVDHFQLQSKHHDKVDNYFWRIVLGKVCLG
jgi:hypothetical protein